MRPNPEEKAPLLGNHSEMGVSMMQVLLVIIACGTGNGTGCAIHSLWVSTQTCENAKNEISRSWNATVDVYCISSEIKK